LLWVTAVDTSRLPQIEQLTLNLNQQKTALQSQYETEKQLTDSLKACREDISRQKEISPSSRNWRWYRITAHYWVWMLMSAPLRPLSPTGQGFLSRR
jgi:hypothetical protein